MIPSITGEYALRAMVYLTQQPSEELLSGPIIAEQTQIPRKYLGMVLTKLVQAGHLVAYRGKNGGFRLARPATEISLFDVLAPFEALDRKSCPFGNPQCSDSAPCLAHQRWKKLKEFQEQFLKSTSLQDVSVAQKPAKASRKKARL
jgi:Rrf2 family protein